MTAQIDFAPNVRHLGQGPRKVLALHCTIAFSGAWGGLAKLVGDQVTLVAPDMPSHGASPDWDETSNFADTVYAGALSCLTEPMDIIGHSFGGATALRIAAEHPELVRSVTMIEPVFFCVARHDHPGSMEEHDAKASPFFEAIQAGNMEGAARRFNRMWSPSGPAWDQMPDGLKAAMTRAIHVVPDTVGFLYEDSCGLLEPCKLDAITMPCLLMRGADSIDVIKATNTGLARRIPHAQDSVIQEAGHMAPITHPQAVADIWSRFLAEQP